MVVRIRIKTEANTCKLDIPSGQPVIVRDANDRMTSHSITYTSILKQSTFTWNTDNTIATQSLNQISDL